MNHRAGEVAGVEWIANAQALGHRHEFGGVAVHQFLVDENPSRGNATLTARLEGTDDPCGHSDVETRVVADDNGTLASHFRGHDAVMMVCRELLDTLADVPTAGEQDDIDTRISDQCLTCRPIAVN